MKHCLVTGGAGFIGSHLVEHLLAAGHHVTVLDDESTGAVSNLHAVEGQFELAYVKGDAADKDLVESLVRSADEVYHLAAAVGVRRVADEPIDSIERNIHPTQVVLAAIARQWQARQGVKFFLASSSEVYGKNPKSVWNEEDSLVFGPTTCTRWSYGASKAIDEFLALAYGRQMGLPVVVGRFFNVIGPRQTGRYGMVLPRLVARALAGEPPLVHDDGQQVRCFAHVNDVCRAVSTLMEEPAAVGQVVNIGSDQPISILQLAERVVALVNPKLDIEFESYRHAYSEDFEDVRRRVPDLSRLKKLIKFTPRHDLDDAIRDVIEWQKK